MESDKFNSFGAPRGGKRKTSRQAKRTSLQAKTTRARQAKTTRARQAKTTRARPRSVRNPASLPVVSLAGVVPRVKKVKTVTIIPYPTGTVITDRTTQPVNIFLEYLNKKGLNSARMAPVDLFYHQQYFFIIWQIAMLSEINHDFGEGARSSASNIVAFGVSVKKFLRAQLLDNIDKFMISGGFKTQPINLEIPRLLGLIILNPKLKEKILKFFNEPAKLNANYLKELGKMINEDTGIIMARPDQYFSEPFLERYLKTLNPNPVTVQISWRQRFFGSTPSTAVISKNLFIFVDAVASSGDLQDVLKYIYQYLDPIRNPPSSRDPYESAFKVYFIQSPASKFDSAGVSFLEKILSDEEGGFSGFQSWSKSNTFYPLDLFGPSRMTFELTVGSQLILTPTSTITKSPTNYILYNFTYEDTSPGQTSLTINTINNELADISEQNKLKTEISNFSLPSIIASQTLQKLIKDFEQNTTLNIVTNFNKLLSVMLVKSMGDLGQELTALFTFQSLKTGFVYNGFNFNLSNTQLVYLTIDQFSFLLLQYLPTIPAILGKKAVSDEERKKATNISSVPYELNFPLKFDPTMNPIELRNYLKTLYDISESDSNIDKVAYMLEHDYAVEEFDAPEFDLNGKKIGNELDVTSYYNYFKKRNVPESAIIKSIIIQLTNDKLNIWKKYFFEKPIITQKAIDDDIDEAGTLLTAYFIKYNLPRIPLIPPILSPVITTIKNELIRRYTQMLNTSTPIYTPFGKKRWIEQAIKKQKQKGTTGSFKRWCKSKGFGDKVTLKCINKAKRSKNKTIRQKANFAKNIGGYKNKSNHIKQINRDIKYLLK